MLNGVVSRINGFIGGINQGLEALGSERRISLVPDLDLGEIENRFEGAASAATTAAQAAFDQAFEDNPLTAPDLGLTDAANRALESANLYRGAARDLADGARAPLESWQALRDAVRGTDEDGADALAEATAAAERFETALDGAGQAASDAGAAAGAAAAAAEPNAETTVTGWQAVTAALSDYASKARDIGGDIGQSLVGAFQSAENAVGQFVKTGKLDFRDLVTSLLADLAQLAARRFILGPIANALSGVFSGAGVRGLTRPHWGHGPRSPTPTSCMRAGMSAPLAPRAWSRPRPSPPRRGCMAAAWLAFATTRCPRSCSAASGCFRAAKRRTTARAGSTSPSWRVTPRASGSPAPKSPPTSPVRSRSGGGACECDPASGNRLRGPEHEPRRDLMAFHEVRFPDNISRGARGGPERRTQIVELASGDEERNASWANSRRRYDVAYGIRRADDLAAVVAFFEARNGRLHGFRFKDWGDHKSCLPSGTPSPNDQAIGTGDGATTAFQLVKRYASSAQSWTRTIAKPVAGTVRIALGGVEQPSGWSVDTATGVVTFSAAPGAGVAITAGFEFDVPVRFDTDVLDVTLDLERLGSITSIPLLEIRR